jgi:antitoxin (DNA-binding transcriptional repressor) of toxin-antitoxin stability system
MEISLTELRQRLFELADRVLETGEVIVISRRGARLRISRDEPQAQSPSRLARLRPQELENGPPLEPHESPAEWSELASAVAEPARDYVTVKPATALPRSRGRKPREPRSS